MGFIHLHCFPETIQKFALRGLEIGKHFWGGLL